MFQIGPYQIHSPTLLAPMAGVTDLPFRKLCRSLGAGMTVSEMITTDESLFESQKSQLRRDHSGEPGPISVQIVGNDPKIMAKAAIYNEEQGAQIIDINMGCPAKKVLKKAAGSALLKDVDLVERILAAVVAAVSIPVTLKIRTGWCPNTNNAVEIAKIAERQGIKALAVHGRSRACAFKGDAEYNSIRQVKRAVNIPIIANGDIKNPEKAAEVLSYTGADAVMIGRAAQGKPWIFREIDHYLATGKHLKPPSTAQLQNILIAHISEIHRFYGEFLGVRITRKHVNWYLQTQKHNRDFRKTFNQIECPELQKRAICTYLEYIESVEELAA